MATNALSDLIKTVNSGENSDDAYLRLYGHQMRPCTFRRVFSALQRGEETVEVDADTAKKIKGYVDEKMNVDEAFASHCPEFIGPGEFLRAYEKEIKSRKAAPEPEKKAVKAVKPVPAEEKLQS